MFDFIGYTQLYTHKNFKKKGLENVGVLKDTITGEYVAVNIDGDRKNLITTFGKPVRITLTHQLQELLNLGLIHGVVTGKTLLPDNSATQCVKSINEWVCSLDKLVLVQNKLVGKDTEEFIETQIRSIGEQYKGVLIRFKKIHDTTFSVRVEHEHKKATLVIELNNSETDRLFLTAVSPESMSEFEIVGVLNDMPCGCEFMREYLPVFFYQNTIKKLADRMKKWFRKENRTFEEAQIGFVKNSFLLTDKDMASSDNWITNINKGGVSYPFMVPTSAVLLRYDNIVAVFNPYLKYFEPSCNFYMNNAYEMYIEWLDNDVKDWYCREVKPI
jgi:hypothetical protein